MTRKLWLLVAALCCLALIGCYTAPKKTAWAVDNIGIVLPPPEPAVAVISCCLGTFNQEQAGIIGARIDVCPIRNSDTTGIDSVQVYFVDSLSMPGTGVAVCVWRDRSAQQYTKCAPASRWKLHNLLGGNYWIYADVYRDGVKVGSTDWVGIRLVTFPPPNANVELQLFNPGLYGGCQRYGE